MRTRLFIDNTASLKDACDLGLMRVPRAKKGNECHLFRVGEAVTPSGRGPLKEGCMQGTVVKRWRDFGYCYYSVRYDGMARERTERQKDLMPA